MPRSCRQPPETRELIWLADREPARAQALLQTIVDHIPVALIAKETASGQLRVCHWNRAAELLTGILAADALGRTMEELLPPAQADLCRRQDLEVVRTGQPIETDQEFWLPGSRGVRWVHLRKLLVPGEDGRPTLLLTVLGDITSRRESEQALRAAAERLAAAEEIARVGLFESEAGGSRQQWSDGLFKLLGFKPGEATPSLEWAMSLAHPEDAGVIDAARREVFEKGAVETEARWVRKDGRVLWLHQRIAMERDEEGRPTRAVGLVQDVTERHELQAAMAESAERFRLVAAATSDVVWEYDFNADRHGWIGDIERLLRGQRPAPVSLAEFLELIHPADREQVRALAAEARGRGGRFEAEYRVPLGDELRWWQDRGWIALDDAGRPLRCVGAISDITDRKRSEAALHEARAQADGRAVELAAANARLQHLARAAESASVAKSEFLANMSHEIRTPMNAILGFADLALEVLADPRRVRSGEAERCLRTVLRNSRHLLEIIDDILDLSRVEAGRFEADLAPVSVLPLLEQVRDLLRDQAASRGLVLELEADDAATATIATDARRVRQILINLAGNAIKFAEHGVVRLVARRAVDGRLAIDVIDSGVGVPAEQLERIFEPFAQVDASVSRQHGGAGLGLALSRRLAQALGGDLTVQSRLGVGSCFTLLLPATRPESTPGAPAALERAATAGAPAAASPSPADDLAGIRVLLAEDGFDNQRLVRAMLERDGAVVECVENGQAALHAVAKAWSSRASYDVILMDMQMPELDGYEATARLRSAGCATPIIALTAHAMRSDRERCLAAGCDDYASKPIHRAALLRLVAHWARKAPHVAGADGTAAQSGVGLPGGSRHS